MYVADHALHADLTPGPDGSLRLALAGELDLQETVVLLDVVDEALRHGPRPILVDASGLRFLDSSGIRALVTTRQRVLGAGGELRIVAVAPEVHQILRITGLLEFFGVR